MKKVYEKPMMVCDVFTADEYVAACGTHYIFKCDASTLLGDIFGVDGSVWVETNGVDGLQREDKDGVEMDTRRSTYHNCGEEHDAAKTDEFLNGYLYTGFNAYPVVIWTGVNDNNTHCTKALNTEEVTRS